MRDWVYVLKYSRMNLPIAVKKYCKTCAVIKYGMVVDE